MLGKPDSGPGYALVVGLGNPGRSYRSTRHNAGCMAADEILTSSREIANGRWPDGKLWLAESGGKKFLVLEPSTFMNLSGRAVRPVLEAYKIKPEQVIVIHDDIDLPVGDVRFKTGGGTGGHKGLSSIIDQIGTRDFSRIRIGVGRPPEGMDAAQYVLERFEPGEAGVAGSATREAAEVAISSLKEA